LKNRKETQTEPTKQKNTKR